MNHTDIFDVLYQGGRNIVLLNGAHESLDIVRAHLYALVIRKASWKRRVESMKGQLTKDQVHHNCQLLYFYDTVYGVLEPTILAIAKEQRNTKKRNYIIKPYLNIVEYERIQQLYTRLKDAVNALRDISDAMDMVITSTEDLGKQSTYHADDLLPPPYTCDASLSKEAGLDLPITSKLSSTHETTLPDAEAVNRLHKFQDVLDDSSMAYQAITGDAVRLAGEMSSVTSNVTAGDLIIPTAQTQSSAIPGISALTRKDLVGLGAGTIGAGAVVGGAKFFTDLKACRTEQNKLNLAEEIGDLDKQLKTKEIYLKDAEIAIKEEELKHVAEKSKIELQILKARIAKEQVHHNVATASTQTEHGRDGATEDDPLGSHGKVKAVKTTTIIKVPGSTPKASTRQSTSLQLAERHLRSGLPPSPWLTASLYCLIGLLAATHAYQALLVLVLALGFALRHIDPKASQNARD